MKTIKVAGLFLEQLAGHVPPFNPWVSITNWAADIGYKDIQVHMDGPADRPQEGGFLKAKGSEMLEKHMLSCRRVAQQRIQSPCLRHHCLSGAG